MQNSYNNSQVTYAGFWVRAAAYAIDSVIVFCGLMIVRLAMLGIGALIQGTALDGNLLFTYTLKDMVLYAAQVLYFILLTYYTGTTAGKRLMNLRVVAAGEEKKLTLLNVVYRETIGRFLSAFILGIGYLMAGIDKEKRGLHDILGDTRVIYACKVKAYPTYERRQPPKNPGPDNLGQKSEPAPSEPTPPLPGSYRMVEPSAEKEEK